MRIRLPATALGALLLAVLLTSCEWREVQRQNQLPQCVQEQSGLRVDVFPQLVQVETNLLASGAMPDVSRESYRTLLDSLYDALLSGRALPVRRAALCRAALCRDVEDCAALVRPEVSVTYPHCYREIAREYDLPDSTGFWARQGEIWDGFFRRGNWRPDDIRTSIHATPPDRFAEFEVRAFYTQHAIYVVDCANSFSVSNNFSSNNNHILLIPRINLSSESRKARNCLSSSADSIVALLSGSAISDMKLRYACKFRFTVSKSFSSWL